MSAAAPSQGALRTAAPSPFAYFASATLKAFNTNKTSWIGLAVFLIVVVAAILAPELAPFDPNDQNILEKLRAPTLEHWLGTDRFGRDTVSPVGYGARISLIIGVVSTLAAMVIGTAIGMLAGWHGGRLGTVTMQAIGVLLAFPALLLGLILVGILRPSMINIIIATALTPTPPFARTARAPTIAVKEREFVDTGRALGYSDTRILIVHILPNIFPEILVMGSLWLANAIRTEASLAFVGLGVKPPTATWGGMIREGFENILDSYWLAAGPGVAILIVIFALNPLGDGLRDAIDPKLKGEA